TVTWDEETLLDKIDQVDDPENLDVAPETRAKIQILLYEEVSGDIAAQVDISQVVLDLIERGDLMSVKNSLKSLTDLSAEVAKKLFARGLGEEVFDNINSFSEEDHDEIVFYYIAKGSRYGSILHNYIDLLIQVGIGDVLMSQVEYNVGAVESILYSLHNSGDPVIYEIDYNEIILEVLEKHKENSYPLFQYCHNLDINIFWDYFDKDDFRLLMVMIRSIDSFEHTIFTAEESNLIVAKLADRFDSLAEVIISKQDHYQGISKGSADRLFGYRTYYYAQVTNPDQFFDDNFDSETLSWKIEDDVA
ncbi:hypothetical protein KKF73_07260, partial [Patescibacteria group bacterium]|nr:hypothetical protein [Patescibacteria group bacterium]